MKRKREREKKKYGGKNVGAKRDLKGKNKRRR